MPKTFFDELNSLMREPSGFPSTNTYAIGEWMQPTVAWDLFSKYAHLTANEYAMPTLVKDASGVVKGVGALRQKRRFLPPPLTCQVDANQTKSSPRQKKMKSAGKNL